MILAHLSELHLGFRAYERTERGRNVRERDVAAAFERAVEALRRIGPDLVIVVGDVFDRADPPPSALLALTRGLDALRGSLPGVPVAFVAGARDTPLRGGEDTALSVLESLPGVEVATREMREVRLDALDARLCLVPWAAAIREPRPEPAPDRTARWNVVAAYGAAGTGGPGVEIDPSAWSYVALGGEHGHRSLAPNTAYAGALERVGGNPWDEAAEEKGLVTVDLVAGALRFHPLPVRPVVALAAVRTPAAGAAGLPDRVREVTREIPGGIEDKIVRLRVRGARQRDLMVLQGPLLADLAERTLHLDVEVEPTARGPLPTAAQLLPASVSLPPAEVPRLAALPSRVATEDDPFLGALDLELPDGLVAVLSADASAGRRFFALLGRAGERRPAPWLEPEYGSPAELLSVLEDALAGLCGSAPLDAFLAGRGTGAETDAARELERRMADLEGAEEELRAVERELRDLRADHAEAAGDLEVATMEWLRERQDAETHLQAYRDRARELKGRLAQIEASGAEAPCPTCGRVLREHYDEVLAELRDEWEAVVQDGSWWRRRREQLDLKPGSLQELEGRALRLQAAVEDSAERVEASRSRVRERDEVRQRLAEAGRPDGPSGDDGAEERTAATVREAAATLRTRIRELLLEEASRHAARITGSRILALGCAEGAVRLEGLRGPLPPAEEDLAAAEVSLRLSGAVLASGDEVLEGVVLPTSVVERLREGDRIRLLETLPGLRDRVRTVLVGMHGDTAERRHESLEAILEVGTGRPSARWLPAGTSRIVLPARTGRRSRRQSPA